MQCNALSGVIRESEIRVIRANRPDALQKKGCQLRMIRANRFAQIALRIARATKVMLFLHDLMVWGISNVIFLSPTVVRWTIGTPCSHTL